jgi:hypothetical protein
VTALRPCPPPIVSSQALTGECFLRAYHAELVPLRVRQHGPGLGAALPDIDPASAEGEQALDLAVTFDRAGGQVEMHPVLDCLRFGHRHEADADRSGVVGADDYLTLALGQNVPAERLCPEPGKPRQVVGVDHDVMQSDRHADQYPSCCSGTSFCMAICARYQAAVRRVDRRAAAAPPLAACVMPANGDGGTGELPIRMICVDASAPCLARAE